MILNNFTIGQGILIVIVLSVLYVPLWSVLPLRSIKYAAAVEFPLLLSIGLYWLPNYGHFDDELRAWAGLFIIVWYLPSLLVSLVLTFVVSYLFRRIRLRINPPDGPQD